MSTATVKQKILYAKSRVAPTIELYRGPPKDKAKVRPMCKRILMEVVAVLEKHRVRCPELADAYEYLGYMEAKIYESRPDKRRFDAGFALIEKALAMRGKFPFDEKFKPIHYVLDYNNLGVDYLYVKRFDDAIRCYMKALRLFKKFSRKEIRNYGSYPNAVFIKFGIYLGLAEAFHGAGQLRKAERVLTRMLPGKMRKLTRHDRILEQMGKCLTELHQVRTKQAALKAK